MSNWKDLGSGIMIWEPPVEAGINATTQSLSRLSVETVRTEGKNNNIIALAHRPGTQRLTI